MEQSKEIREAAEAEQELVVRAERVEREIFPGRFDFFTFGRVESVARACELREFMPSPFLVTFRISGEENGLCVIAFEQRPAKDSDVSMFTEIANILAGKLVNALADATAGGIELAPPEPIELGSRKHRYLLATFQAARSGTVPVKRYEYISTASPGHMALRLAFLPASLGRGAGNGGST